MKCKEHKAQFHLVFFFALEQCQMGQLVANKFIPTFLCTFAEYSVVEIGPFITRFHKSGVFSKIVSPGGASYMLCTWLYFIWNQTLIEFSYSLGPGTAASLPPPHFFRLPCACPCLKCYHFEPFYFYYYYFFFGHVGEKILKGRLLGHRTK